MNIRLQINPNIYLKDPETSVLGRRIVSRSILMIHRMGFEQFTFRKLAAEIESTEASIYRYFENKHKLLIYLVNWYWNWLEYRLVVNLSNLESPVERLRMAIQTFTHQLEPDPVFDHIDERMLQQIVISEGAKAYLTKEVDDDNKEGCFRSYKTIVNKLAEIIREENPDYRFAHSLISTVIESAHQQQFFAVHLPSLTEIKKKQADQLKAFLTELVLKAIRKD